MALTPLSSLRETSPSEKTAGEAVLARGLSEKEAGGEKDISGASTRKCLATGKLLPKEQLIRFVVGPSGQIVPDIACKLPGRGLWVEASASTLALATQKNLFAKAARCKASVDPSLPSIVLDLLTRRCLDLLGLARGAGLIVTGEPQVEQALKKGGLAYIILSADAGADITKKMTRAMKVPCGLTRDQLGEAVGRGACVAIGLKTGILSEKLRLDLMRWQGVGASPQGSSDKAPDLLSCECGHHD